MSAITGILSRFTFQSAVDILLVAAVFYALLRLFRGTAAVQLLRGILVLTFGVVLVTNMVELTAFRWLVSNSLNVVLVAIPVIFQPELRRALEKLGRTTPLFGRRASQAATEFLVSELIRTVDTLSPAEAWRDHHPGRHDRPGGVHRNRHAARFNRFA
ncbi:hypothetical protein [Candidatus Amarolinea dominans]|uniref:hypothetical protein n=1 Tax=Candidatus Amarolinea dominans TaxID=3140696 RepID=UPI0031CC45C2